jgi:microcystin-dependent protein
MPDLTQIGHPVIEVAHRETLSMGTIVATPASENASLFVVVEGFTSEDAYTVPAGNWSARGAALPTPGALCLVAFDENGEAWVPVWAGATTFAPVVVQIPIGGMLDYAGTGTPDGPALWIPCDGASLLRAGTYAALYGRIGTTYGSVDGTHFNVPNTPGRTVVGAGAGAGLTSRAAGASGGEERHLLSIGEMPSHDHTPGTGANSVDHTHSAGGASFLLTGSAGALAAGGPANFNTSTNTGGESTTHTHAIWAQGGGATHENMPPFIAIPKWIRYA